MPRYYLVAGAISCEGFPTEFTGGDGVCTFDLNSSGSVIALETGLLVHALNQKIYAVRRANATQQAAIKQFFLFPDKAQADSFVKLLHFKGIDCGSICPVFEIEEDATNVEFELMRGETIVSNWRTAASETTNFSVSQKNLKNNAAPINCCILSESQSAVFKENLKIVNVHVPNFKKAENIYLPKALAEEVERPLLDQNFFWCLGLTFWTVIVPIIYTIYRLWKRDMANNILDNQYDWHHPLQNELSKNIILTPNAKFNWVESEAPAPTRKLVRHPSIYEELFPAGFAQRKFESIFRYLHVRVSTPSDPVEVNYKQVFRSRSYKPTDFKISEAKLAQLVAPGKNTLIEIPIQNIASGTDYLIPLSEENVNIIRQMIQANYCGCFADQAGKATPAATLILAELAKYSSAEQRFLQTSKQN